MDWATDNGTATTPVFGTSCHPNTTAGRCSPAIAFRSVAIVWRTCHRHAVDLMLELQHCVHGVLVIKVHEAKSAAAICRPVSHDESTCWPELREVCVETFNGCVLVQTADEDLQWAISPLVTMIRLHHLGRVNNVLNARVDAARAMAAP